MRVQINLDIPDEDKQQQLIQRAILAGYMREEPRRAWTAREKKEAIRYAIADFVRNIN